MIEKLKSSLSDLPNLAIVVGLIILCGAHSWQFLDKTIASALTGSITGLLLGLSLVAAKNKYINEVFAMIFFIVALFGSLHEGYSPSATILICLVSTIAGYFAPKWYPYFIGAFFWF